MEIIFCFSEKTRQFPCLLKTYKLKLDILACTAKNVNFQGLFFKVDISVETNILFLFFNEKQRISWLPDNIKTKSQTVLITSVHLPKNILTVKNAEMVIFSCYFDHKDL